MERRKKLWLLSMFAVLALLIMTLVGVRYARESVVQRTVEAGINTMLESGELDANDIDRLLKRADGQSAEPDTGTSTHSAGTSAEGTPSSLPADGSMAHSAEVANDGTDASSGIEASEEKQTVEELANQIMGQIPVDEQNQLMNMVFSRLSVKETLHVAAILLGNSSEEEIQDAKKMLYERFTPEEITILKGYYNSFLGK